MLFPSLPYSLLNSATIAVFLSLLWTLSKRLLSECKTSLGKFHPGLQQWVWLRKWLLSYDLKILGAYVGRGGGVCVGWSEILHFLWGLQRLKKKK